MEGHVLHMHVQLSRHGLPYGFAPLLPGHPAIVVFDSNLPWFEDGDSYYRPKPNKKGFGTPKSRTPGEDIGDKRKESTEKYIGSGEETGDKRKESTEKYIGSGEETGDKRKDSTDKYIGSGEETGDKLKESTEKAASDSGGTHKKSTVKELSEADVKEILIQHVINGGLSDWAGLIRQNEELQRVSSRFRIREMWRSIADKEPATLGGIVKEMKLKGGGGNTPVIEGLWELAKKREAIGKMQQANPTRLSSKSQGPKTKGKVHLPTPLLKKLDKGKVPASDSMDKGKLPASDSKEVPKLKIRIRGPRPETTPVAEMDTGRLGAVDNLPADLELYSAMQESKRTAKKEMKKREMEIKSLEKKGESSRAPPPAPT